MALDELFRLTNVRRFGLVTPYDDDVQKQIADASKKALEDSHRFKRILTQIVPASTFWRAEAYHQHYYKTNAFQYRMYRVACGRDARLADLWGTHH